MTPFLIGRLIAPLLLFVPWLIIAMCKGSDSQVWFCLIMIVTFFIGTLFGMIFGLAAGTVMIIVYLIVKKFTY